MTEFDSGRRKFLQACGVALTVAVAGCSGDDDGGDGGDDGGDGGDDGGSGGGVPSEVDDHLSDANLYEGSVEDMTGESSVTVEVGAGSDGLAFSPPAVRVDTGTTVTWEWTGEGGAHNVAHNGGDFESETVEEAGHTFEYTFDSAGNYNYHCTPHETLGMLGSVIVE